MSPNSSPFRPLTEAPRLPQEAPDAILPLFHGEEGEVRQAAPGDEQPGPDQDPVQEVPRAAGEKKGWDAVGRRSLRWCDLGSCLLTLSKITT